MDEAEFNRQIAEIERMIASGQITIVTKGKQRPRSSSETSPKPLAIKRSLNPLSKEDIEKLTIPKP
jgi:hypothetical protein